MAGLWNISIPELAEFYDTKEEGINFERVKLAGSKITTLFSNDDTVVPLTKVFHLLKHLALK